VDEKPLIEKSEPADWDPGKGGSGNGPIASVRQQPLNEPLLLKRWRFDVGNTGLAPNEPTNGLALWIECLPSGPKAPEK
jgi:hypothetical protein